MPVYFLTIVGNGRILFGEELWRNWVEWGMEKHTQKILYRKYLLSIKDKETKVMGNH